MYKYSNANTLCKQSIFIFGTLKHVSGIIFNKCYSFSQSFLQTLKRTLKILLHFSFDKYMKFLYIIRHGYKILTLNEQIDNNYYFCNRVIFTGKILF
jgi:hypothetical protein